MEQSFEQRNQFVPDDSTPTILIVDDEPANLALLSEVLRPAYRTRAANCGERVLRIATSDPRPDLILLDVMMPEMDGYQVLQRLKEIPNTADIPVIFISAMNDEMDEEEGLKQGAVDYITKPIKSSIVLARVQTHLELKQSRDRLKNQNALLESEVAKRMYEIQLIQDVSLSAMAQLAETRDNETGNHIMRTQAYVDALARQLLKEGPYRDQLDERRISLISKATPLHDIGKVGIPDAILLKPGPLSESEFEIMKNHARIGGEAIARALERVQNIHVGMDIKQANGALCFLEIAQEIATSHHERWDGKGYPDRLAGEEIPLAARLMSIADVFDALIHKRVYKPAMPTADAIAYIRQRGGSQFDPVIVDAFMQVQDRIVEISRQYGESIPDPQISRVEA
jgi:putative two-component system response regulator